MSSSTTPSKIAVHITPEEGKQVFVKQTSGMYNAAYKMPCLYYDDGTQVNTTVAGAQLEVTKPGWYCMCTENSYNYQILGNLNKTLKFKKHPDTLYKTKLSEYTIEAVAVSSPDTLTILNHNYNYIDGYDLFRFGSELSHPTWVLADAVAKENDLATVGDNYDLYRCNNVPKWELWSISEGGGTDSSLPTGGTAGQVLGKLSDADGDIGWIDQTDGGGSGGGSSIIINRWEGVL